MINGRLGSVSLADRATAGARKLMLALQDMGIRLSLHDDKLRAEPQSAITDEARHMIREHKSELIELARKEVRHHDGSATEAAELLLTQLKDLGIRLSLHDGRIRVKHGSGIAEKARRLIRAHKRELVELLRQERGKGRP